MAACNAVTHTLCLVNIVKNRQSRQFKQAKQGTTANNIDPLEVKRLAG